MTICSYEEKTEALKKSISSYCAGDVVVAFSGGVDSSVVLKIAIDCAAVNGANVYAVTFNMSLLPQREIKKAKAVARELGAIHKVITCDDLSVLGIEENPVNRCYRCKKRLFGDLKEFGKVHGTKVILDGTNSDDLKGYRPGNKALKELGVVSPLAENNITKAEVRQIAAELGLSVAKKPSTPCLATRFPYGTKLSCDKLRQVEQGEYYLKTLGFANVRCRVHGDILRLEVDEENMAKVLFFKTEIVAKSRELGFNYVTLDLVGFHSGSMDLQVEKES